MGRANVVLLPLDQIALSARNREALQRDSRHIENLRMAYEIGRRVPPIVVAQRSEDCFEVIDGRHRFLAAERAGLYEIEAVVRGG